MWSKTLALQWPAPKSHSRCAIAKPSCPSSYPLSTLSAPRSLLPLPLAQRPSTSPTSSSSSQPHPLSPLTRLSARSHSQNTTRPKTSSAARPSRLYPNTYNGTDTLSYTTRSSHLTYSATKVPSM